VAKYVGDKACATISELALEFHTSYRTLSRELAERGVEPDGKDTRGKPLYRIGDAVRAHYPWARPAFEVNSPRRR
jgi:hypothetical protein